jgi:hypothetical protein
VHFLVRKDSLAQVSDEQCIVTEDIALFDFLEMLMRGDCAGCSIEMILQTYYLCQRSLKSAELKPAIGVIWVI